MEFIPSGTRKVKIHTNVIIMQNSAGQGNFRLSNPEELQALEYVFSLVNTRLETLTTSNHNCSKDHVSDIRLEFVPNFIEVRDNILWDCEADPTPLSFNWNSNYLRAVSALAAQSPNYIEGFDVIISNEADAFYAYTPGGNVPLWTLPEYSNHYNGKWYSGIPSCSDLEKKAR